MQDDRLPPGCRLPGGQFPPGGNDCRRGARRSGWQGRRCVARPTAGDSRATDTLAARSARPAEPNPWGCGMTEANDRFAELTRRGHEVFTAAVQAWEQAVRSLAEAARRPEGGLPDI